jgi:hypothetical protein
MMRTVTMVSPTAQPASKPARGTTRCLCTDTMPDTDLQTVTHRLHRFVTAGPWDLDIAWAMSAQGYDEVKWAEGQAILAELINCEVPARTVLTAAAGWYQAAAVAAQHALAGRPHLLTKLGVQEA